MLRFYVLLRRGRTRRKAWEGNSKVFPLAKNKTSVMESTLQGKGIGWGVAVLIADESL
jgi:hypothetical protein